MNTSFGTTAAFSPDFEGISGVSKTQGEKCGKALAALEYFNGISDEELPQEMINMIRDAYS